MTETRVEAKLASEAWLSEARQLARVGTWEWDLERDTFVFSAQMCRMLGLDVGAAARPREDFLAWSVPEDAQRTRAALQRSAETGEPFVHEYRVRCPDDQVRALHCRGERLDGEHGGRRRLLGTCWDITELWEAVAWPAHSASLLRATLEASADGILVVDRTGEIVTYNQRFLELWRIPAELPQELGNDGLIAWVKEQLIDPTTFVRTAYDNQAHPASDYFLPLRFKDGRMLERFSRPQWVRGEIVGRVLTFRDVTERERLLERAQEAVRLRDEFLAIAAHEIRGPITSMRLAVQALQAGALPPEGISQSLAVIDRSQRRLADFVDKLLDLGRIRTGDLRLEIGRFDLVEVVRDVVARHDLELSRSGSPLALHADAPVIGAWDRSRMEQIVTNLLSNAIRFGQGRPIDITVSASQESARLVVRDRGLGVDPAAIARIFLPFERGVSIRHFGGLGLGLHLVQTFVQAMGGSVEVDSTPGSGSTFVVELPLVGRPRTAETD